MQYEAKMTVTLSFTRTGDHSDAATLMSVVGCLKGLLHGELNVISGQIQDAELHPFKFDSIENITVESITYTNTKEA